jgi:hypothetical protein
VKNIELLTTMYQRFNARDMEAVLACMHDQVVWANGMDGGYVYGRDGVREYWTRQWAMIDPHVDPIGFVEAPSGELLVNVHAVVRERDGKLLSDQMVLHAFRIDDGLVTRFEIRD